MPTGLTVITAGRTGPNRSVRFGGDALLDDRGRRDITAIGAPPVGPPTRSRCGPEPATVESAGLLGVTEIDAGLSTLDVGDWAGRTPEELPPDELAMWFGDPRSCPHGGETIAEFVARIRHWLDAHRRIETVIVAMPVAQALMCADAADFFATSVRPATQYRVAAETGC